MFVHSQARNGERVALSAALFVFAVSSAHAESATRPLKLSALYHDQTSASGQCNRGKERGAVGFEPAAKGRYPLFIYLTGTQMKYDGAEALRMARGMAERGFVSVSIDYDNGAYAYCTGMQQKARCVYGPKEANSAITSLCARANVDCAAGIVVSGFSQGANLSSLAKNYDARVRAAYLLGHGHRAGNFMDVTSCMEHDATAFGPEDVRSVNGEHDGFFGIVPERVKAQLEVVTGSRCPDAPCLTGSGAGFVIVQDSELKDGKADHCYFFNAADGRCSKFDGFDPAWESGKSPWALNPCLDWLASHVTEQR